MFPEGIKWEHLLREKCPYSEFFWSVISRIRTRKTPNTDTFHSVIIKKWVNQWIEISNDTASSPILLPVSEFIVKNMFKLSRTYASICAQQTFTCSNLTKQTLKKVANMFKVNNKSTRTPLLHLFLLLCCLFRTGRFMMEIARKSLKRLFPPTFQECWAES